MNSIIKTTEVTIDSKPKRRSNAKPVFCLTDGSIYASTIDAANAIGAHNSTVSMCCTGKVGTVKGKRYCYVKDLASHVLDVSSEIKSLHADASIYRAQKAEEERIEAERKAKEEAERKRVERIAELEERAMTMATEMDAINAELVRLRKANTITREMAKGFCADLQGTYKRNYWVPLRVIADDMQWTLERAKEICDALVDFGMIEREGNAYKL